jgi:hypothetical protein
MQFLTNDLTAAFMPQQGAPVCITPKLRRAFPSKTAECFGRFLQGANIMILKYFFT